MTSLSFFSTNLAPARLTSAASVSARPMISSGVAVRTLLRRLMSFIALPTLLAI